MTVQKGYPELTNPPDSTLVGPPPVGANAAPGRAGVVTFFLWRAVLAVIALAVGLLSFFGIELAAGPASLLGALFALAVPGTAILVWWLRRPIALWTAMCAALSASATLLLGQSMLTTGLWQPGVAVGLVAVASAASLVAHLFVRPGFAPQGDAPVAVAPSGRRLTVVGVDVTVALSVIAVVLWFVGLRSIDPNTLGGAGLIEQLSPVLLAAYAVLAVAAVLEIFTRARTVVLAGQAIVGVVGLFGLQTFSYAVARVPVAWLHWGFSEQIGRDGAVLQGLDSRYSWPGFFAGLGTLTRALGITDPADFIAFAPIVLAGLAAFAFFSIATTVLGNGSARWLALWIYVTANWVGQEYLSPQGLTVVIVLVLLAVVLQYGLRTPLLARRPPVTDATAGHATSADGTGGRALVWTTVVVGSLALAPTHQLSPLFLIITLGILVAFRRLNDPLLVLVPIVAVIAWYLTGALDFWRNVGPGLLAGLGDISGSLSANVGDRLVGQSGRQILVGLRIATALIVFGLALFGVLRLRAQKWEWRLLAVLCAAPFALVLAQAYGGEMLLRSYLFALPMVSIAAAYAFSAVPSRVPEAADRPADFVPDFVPGPGVVSTRAIGAGKGALTACIACVVVAFLAVSSVAVKGQNDSYVSFSVLDLQASEQAYQEVQPGEVLSGLTASGPLRFEQLGEVEQRSVQSTCPISTMSSACVTKLSPDVLVVTPSQDNSGRQYGQPAGWSDALARQLVADGDYRVVWHADGADLAGAWVLRKTSP